MTVVELLVVIAVIVLLLTLTASAVQHARVAAMRVQCVNNLKQIGVACHDIAVSQGTFPTGAIEEPYHQIKRQMSGTWAVNFSCPADSWSGDRHSSLSYLLNSGTSFRRRDDYRNGFQLADRARRLGEFTDGQSVTAAFSERLAAPFLSYDSSVPENHPERFLWWTSKVVPASPGNERTFIEVCRNNRVAVLPKWQFVPEASGIGYDHFLTPNQHGCWNGSFDDADRQEVIVPASSLHQGGVNLLFVDGHVAFVSENVDWNLWQALGTVSGGESENVDFQ
ncbi:MAG: DUF1559 domain-containing protein [Planctomycetota bacterium]|nr:DUF1559 domain-containing protein [Planctomycetaceae bacterium]MDQ3329341.1 DUF1559 domain-containing protein [Planctomycetota bacterium]